MISWLSTQWTGTIPAKLAAPNEAVREIPANYNGRIGSLNLKGGNFAVSTGSPYKADSISLLTQAFDHGAEGPDYVQALFLIPLDAQGGVDRGIQPFFTLVPIGSALAGLGSLRLVRSRRPCE